MPVNKPLNNIIMKDYSGIIKAQIEQEQEYINEHEQILFILKEVDGKPINGRTFNEKRLNGLEFKPKYGMFYIAGKFEHLIGYNTNPIVNSSKFEDFDSCHGRAAKERIKQLQNINVTKVNELYNKIAEHFEGLKQAFGDIERAKLGSYEFPAYYEILRDISQEDKHVRLTDFYFIRK